MKVKELTRLMNDHGTNPVVYIVKYDTGFLRHVYTGRPDKINDEVANLKVNSFTVEGEGSLIIYTQSYGK